MNKLTHNSFSASSVLLGVLISVTSISGFVLSSTSVSADDDDYSFVDDITITVPEACTLSGTGMNSHTASITNGTYYDGDNHEGIGTTTLKAYCNDSGGFAIYAIGYTGDSYTGTNHTKLVGTNNNSNTIATGLATGGSSSDPSNWAMKLSTTSGATYELQLDNGYGSYSLVPDTFTKVAHRDSGTDVGNNATGSTLTSTYAAYINGTQPSDTYVGKVLYTLVHPSTEEPVAPQPSTAGYINYYANASTAVGTMGRQSATDGNTVQLFASNFSRTGYGFAGWSDAYDYATNTNAHFYGPNEDITAPTGTTANGLALYAIWVKSEGSLQNSSKVASVCNRLTQSGSNVTKTLASVSALTDQRDNQTYAIAKLADGNCWMIENLRLENTNSDNTTGALAQGYGTSTTYGNFRGLANPESSNFSDTTTANSLYYSGTQDGTASIDIGTTYRPGYRMPRYNNMNTSARTSNAIYANSNIYSYGNYYTYHAALANTIYYSEATSTDADGKTSETVGTSLCPKGWKLPYGRSTGNGALSGSFYNLNYKINNDSNVTNSTASLRIRSFPNNFLFAGYISQSNAQRGSNGCYWSTTAGGNGDGGRSYYLSFSNTSVTPGTMNGEKNSGRSIRCVADS